MDNQIVIEYELPYLERRIDALLFGKNRSLEDGVALIELKQWSNESVEDCTNDGNVIVDYGRFKKEQPHPSLQVQGYHFDLKDFLAIFSDPRSPDLASCAYCHNYSRNDQPNTLFASKFEKELKAFPVFAKEDFEALGEFLKERLCSGAGLEVFNRFITSPVRPSRKLLEHTSEMINQRQIFNLIDDQIAAYNAIMHKARQLSQSKKKSVVIVKGGPGTGKSVIALEVMGELMRLGKSVMHATGSSAFTNTLRNIVGNRAQRLFKFFNSFINTEPDSIEVLICDEAHRIRASSNSRYTRRADRSGSPQVDELLRVARLSIFLIDEHQIVRPSEIGSVQLIHEAARRLGVSKSEIAEFELQTQFRCSGSDAYLQWVDKVLDVRDSGFARFDARMGFEIFDSPSAMMDAIRQRNAEKRNSARIVAGFCWPWSNPRPDGTLVNDVRIGDFAMPWEKKNEFWKWATDDSGMEQVGTVYTAQGFEFDYIGVIFGNDLVYDLSQKKWAAVPQNSHDTAVTRNNPGLARHLQNVYRVLLTRAHKGVYIYFMDKPTEKYVRSHLGEFKQPEEQRKVVGEVAVVNDEVEQAQLQTTVLPFKRVQRKDVRPYENAVPLLDLKIAAGHFSGEQQVDLNNVDWAELPDTFRVQNGLFVAQVVGESMNRRIPNGAWCLFRANPVGSRQGKVVVVQHREISDMDTGGHVTVKVYESKKVLDKEVEWRHSAIILKPDSTISDYKPIVLQPDQAEELIVVAELVAVLG
ncbi:MAG TPA: DNA/RNA helicase domain-containing protein [Burkholderiales bacterium]|nr:DNA/RNA helicase domain-containing protein [Burkholderiales bacterium]